MGAEQSSSQNSSRREHKLSEEHVNKLLQQQKNQYEQKYAELLRATQAQQLSNRTAQETAREVARKEVERLMQEKQAQQIRQESQLNNNCPSAPELPASSNFKPEGEGCSGVAFSDPLLNPSFTPATNLYPHLCKPGQPSSATATSHTHGAASSNQANNNVSSGKIYPLPSSSSKTDDSFVFVTAGALTSSPRAPPSAPFQPRDRSVSRNRNKASEGDDLNCSTCNNRYTGTGNIYQCSRGHSSCQDCKENFSPCGSWVSRRLGTCRLPITEMRNITLEAYVCERKVHCPNSDEGCCLYIKLADMDMHVKECPFREMACPLYSLFGICAWNGKLSQMAGHFDKVHQMHRQGNIDTEMVLLNLEHENQIVYLIVIGTYNFLFNAKISKKEEKVFMAVQLLGTQQSASKWSYEIHIYNKNEPRRKYQYLDVCRSVNTSIDSLISKSECAAIPLPYANTFLNEGTLNYKFYIKKTSEANNANSGKVKYYVRGRDGGRRPISP